MTAPFPLRNAGLAGPIAVAPLVGAEPGEESHWLGALVSELLTAHLAAGGLSVVPYNITAQAILDRKIALPLEAQVIADLRQTLKVRAVVHGRYVLDEAGKMFGVRLLVDGRDTNSAPLEAAAPLPSFPAFIARTSLAVLERLQVPIDDEVRAHIKAEPRPANFEAFRQLARARMAWSRGENELALTAVNSALTLDPSLEPAMLIEVSIARAADDSATTRQAFRRWADFAAKHDRPVEAAERTLMLGHWLLERGEWAEARRSYEDARNLYKRAGDEVGEARALNNVTNLDLLQGRVPDAIRSYRRTLRIFEDNPALSADAASIYLNLSLAHRERGQRDEAGRALEEALRRAQNLRDPRLQGHCLAQRGALYADMGHWAQAEADYREAANLFDIAADEIGRALVMSHQGLLHRARGSYDQAEQALLSALAVFRSQGIRHEEALVVYNLAELYYVMGIYEQAWDAIQPTVKTFTDLGSGWRRSAQDLLAAIQSALDNLQGVSEELEQPSSAPGGPLITPPPVQNSLPGIEPMASPGRMDDEGGDQEY